jgi:hypothetical protein
MAAACARRDVPLAAAALQFSLRDARVSSTLVGMARPEHVAETVALARHPIPDALWAELDALAPAMGDPEAGRSAAADGRLARLLRSAHRTLARQPAPGGGRRARWWPPGGT